MKSVRLAPRRVFALRDARGTRIRVVAGCAWITEHGSPTDHFVPGGREYRVAGDGVVVVEGATAALGPNSDFSLTDIQIWT